MLIHKKLSVFLICAISLCGCSTQSEEPEISVGVATGEPTLPNYTENQSESDTISAIDLRIGVLKGAGTIACANLVSDKANYYENYIFFAYNTPDEIKNAFLNNEIDIVGLPADETLDLYNRSNKGITCVCSYSSCNYHLASVEPEFTGLDSLSGKNIAVRKDDALAKILLKKIIDESSILNCNIVELDDYEAISESLLNKKCTFSVVPEPFLSEMVAKNEIIKDKMDLYDTWDDYTDTEMFTGIFAIKDSIAKNTAIMPLIASDLKASVMYAKHNIDNTSEFASKLMDSLNKDIIKSSVPGCSLTSVDSEELKDSLFKLYETLNETTDTSVAYTIPENDFIYVQ